VVDLVVTTDVQMEFPVVLVGEQELKPMELELVEPEIEKLAHQHQHHHKEMMVDLREVKLKELAAGAVLVVQELAEL
jgi:hypothetical protein